jgi:hypothetical protein
MSASNAIFHTATIEHHVPGPSADLNAVAYNLQYTKPLVSDLVDRNAPRDSDVQVLALRQVELFRCNLYGEHPEDSDRRVCTIGIGDHEGRAMDAAHGAWFDYHASFLFAGSIAPEETHKLVLRQRVPGTAPHRAATVGVAYDLQYMQPLVESAISKNTPSGDECHVVHAEEMTLMRVNLFGRHPLDNERQVCVGGIADRHYRAMAAAEQAWANYHTSLLFAAHALGSA